MKIFLAHLLLLFLYFFTNWASPEYTRPDPRPLVVRPNDRLDSDPQQVHISLAGKDYMWVSWITPDRNVKSIVDYGKMSGKYENSATGESSSYQYLLYSSGEIHGVKIGPLEPSTTYYYICGGGGPEFSFRTPPSAFPIEFVVVGDLGQTEWAESTLQHVGAMEFDIFLLPGDLSYADTEQPLWDSFGRLVEPYASSKPMMVTQGNHEIETIPIIHPQSFTAYDARWSMPYQESGSTSNLYYSFDVVGTHVIMLGSYTDFDVDSGQYKWLEADLASVDRSKTPWILVLLHAPWYNSNLAHKGEGESMRKAMEELLYKARVDVVFAGHVHAYERFTRVYDNKADKCGPVYVTVGDGGNRDRLANTYENPKPSISLYREASFGHGRLRVFNSTRAHWSWHRNNETDSIVADETCSPSDSPMEETPQAPQSTEQPQQNPQPPPAAAATSVAAATSSSSLLQPATTTTTTNVSSPNLNSAKPSTTPQPQQSTISQARPAFNTRPWQQPTSPYSHFSLPPPPLLSSSSASTSSITAPPPPLAGMAGAPVLHPSTPPPPPASFSSLTSPSYAQQSQIRQPVQGIQGIGMGGTLGTTSSLRPGGVSAHPLRPSQSSHRPQASPNSQSPASQNFQGHGMLRVSSMGSPGSPSPSSSQSPLPQNQPWLSSGTQGKPPLPSPSTRPQASPQSFQQRPHIPQQHQPNTPATSQKQAISSGQQVSQPSASGQQQEHHGQHFPPSRMQQPSSHQQQITRGPGLGSQRPPLGMIQSGPLQPGALNKTATAESEESSTRVLSKRSIQELVNQIDPSEKLDPDVEDILVDIAEDFVESITTFACSLAKHRKSTTLEAKDILLHLERNCNMTLPGFGGDEIKTYKKPFVSDVHRERLAAIKKSVVATDMSTKHPGAQSGGNAKGHMAKGPGNIIGSPPKPKLRETA